METDVLIIGLGAAGSIIASELAEAGLKVTAIEAGPHWNPDKDWVSDEYIMDTKLRWTRPRINASKDGIDIGKGTSGCGVGGGTVHYTMMSMRLHPSDFQTKTLDGIGEDWPFQYKDLEPFYDYVEQELPVSGPEDWPWKGKGKYPQPPHVLDCQAEKFVEGCQKLNLKSAVCPLALVTAYYESPWGIIRNPCINRGYCHQGCKPNAKSSTLLNFVPKAVKFGTKIIDNAFVMKLLYDNGKITGVEYTKEGFLKEIKAKLIVLSAFTVETTRLLLATKNQDFPNGLANFSGLVGKYIMVHSDHLVYAKFKTPVRGYRNPPTTVVTQDYYETRPEAPYKRGFLVAPYSGRPIDFASLAISAKDDLWGENLFNFMKDYNYYIRNGIIGEVLPNVENRIELSDEKDELGLNIPIAYFKYGKNDKKIIKKGLEVAGQIMEAGGAVEIFPVNLSAHLLGGCRMGKDPKTSVTNEYGQSHDIKNLFIAGAPLFITSGAVNPTLTLQAITARQASHIVTNRDQFDL